MKRVRKVISLLAVLCMVFTMNLAAFAASDATPDVAEARNGIIQVRLYYVDNAGNSFCLQTGSGFLLGASSGATTVITNHHVVTLTDEDKMIASEMFGVDFFNSNEVNMEARVAVKRDVEIVTSYVNGSAETDFAILELAQPIYDRTPLKIADSDELLETQSVYALGFPEVASEVEDDSVYTVEDVTISNGIIGKFQTINNIEFILHNAQLGFGNSGGPLVDSNGAVVGVNTLFYGDESGNYYSSIAINEVASVLDALGIVYEKADSSVIVTPGPQPSGETTNTDETVNTGETENTGEAANTGETANTSEAENTGNEQQVSSDDVIAEEGPNWMLIGGIAGGVVLLVVIIIVVVVMSSKKKTTVPGSVSMVAPGTPAAPVPPVGAGTPVPPVPPTFGGTMSMMDSGAGETSVLGGGAGETSVLGGGAMQPTATLIRKKNSETASIAKPLFIIGKERQKVDFCIPDNNSVSRNHANIVCKGGIYYIVDKNSTNYTFVNGNKINPNQEVKLNSGDKIKLADEEFEFRI